MYEKSIADPAGFWGEVASTFHWCAHNWRFTWHTAHGADPLTSPSSRPQEQAVGRGGHRRLRLVEGEGVHQVVLGRRDQHLLQRRRPPRRGGPRRPDRALPRGERRGRRRAALDVQAGARRGVARGERAQVARREEGRPRHPLHADGAPPPDRDARVRAHRRGPLGRLRRLLGGGVGQPHRRRRLVGGGDGERRDARQEADRALRHRQQGVHPREGGGEGGDDQPDPQPPERHR